MGEGAMTGRGAGRCGDGTGMGYGRGMGRGRRCGGGRGFGIRRMDAAPADNRGYLDTLIADLGARLEGLKKQRKAMDE